MLLSSYSYTFIGDRSNNEDFVSSCENEDNGAYVVADGLGGHRDGEIASGCVAEAVTDAWRNAAPGAEEDLSAWLEKNIADANEKLLGLQQELASNMKSTIVALTIRDNEAVWGNTGDSRLYYVHDGELASITADHSVAYKKYIAGEITRRQINTDEDQSCLLRALGNTSRWEPEIHRATIVPGDAFMLCTDGMWEYLYDEEVLADCLKASDAKEWAELLKLRAIERIDKGNDNLSILTVWVE